MSSGRETPRVVVDTNIFVSGILVQQGLPNQLIRAWQQDRFTLITSPPLIAEVERTLHKDRIRRKYPLSEEDIDELIDAMEGAEQITPRHELPVASRDHADNQFLVVALGRDADYLVTGDDDLLVLNGNPALGNLQITTVRTFLSSLGP